MNAPTTDIRILHAADATRRLLEALHHHRHFGQSIDGFSDEHNATRAEANDRTVRAYAHEAGRFACWSGKTVDHWQSRFPDALAVGRIHDAMVQGWEEAMEVAS